MPSINSLGVGSGVLTSELVDKIIAAERKATDLRLETKKAQVTAKLSAIGSVRSAIAKVETAVNALKEPTAFSATTASVSDSKVASVSTSSLAEAGAHVLEVATLAKAQTLRSKTYSAVTSEVGTGTLNFRFGSTSISNIGVYEGFVVDAEHPGGSVVIDGSNNSLAGIRDAINAADLGVKARVVDDGGGFRLVLSGTQAGADNSLEISVGSGATVGLSALEFNAGANTADTNLSQTVAATDAVLNIDGIPVRRNSNSISGVVDGLTFNLTETNAGSPITVTVNRNTAAAVTKVQTFVDAYNNLKSLADSLTAFNLKEKTAGLLLGDATLRTVMTQLRRGLSSVVRELPAEGLRALSDVGLTSDQTKNYHLSLDSDTLSNALVNDPDTVKGLFASTSRATDALIGIVGIGARSSGGEYAVRIARLSTQASLQGSSVAGLAGPIIIDADNDSFGIDVDGASSDTISIAHGSYADGAALASELQQRINADANLRTGDARVSVSYDSASTSLRFNSTRFGSTSRLGLRALDSASAATLGLREQSAATNKGLNAVGAVNGVQALGVGQTLSVTTTAPSATTGRYAGVQIGNAPITIDGTNKTLVARIDGVTGGTIDLTEGSYASGAALATEIEARINADSILLANSKRVTVSYDEGGRFFTFFSSGTGSASSIAFTNVPSATGASLGVAVGAGLSGHPGGSTPDAIAGTQLRILGGSTGDRGSLTVVRGLMHQLSSVFTGVLGTGGSIASRVDGLNDQLNAIAAESTRYGTHISALETRLRTQFATADRLISQLNNTSSFLTQQLEALSAQNRNN